MSSALTPFVPCFRILQSGKPLSEGERILPADHQPQWSQPRVLEDHSHRAGVPLSHDIRQRNGSESGRFDDLPLRRAGNVSVIRVSKISEDDSQFPDHVSCSRRFKLNKDRVIPVELDHEHRQPILSTSNVEASHLFPPFSPANYPAISIQCAPSAQPSLFERRTAYRKSRTPVLRHLGVIEGERLRLASSCRDENYGLAKALLSLTALTVFIAAVAAFTGAL